MFCIVYRLLRDDQCVIDIQRAYYTTQVSGAGGIVNRCLVVPNKAVERFTKFDDVILPEELPKGYSFHQLQKFGREFATK